MNNEDIIRKVINVNNEAVIRKVINATIFATAKTAFDSGRNDVEHSFDELDLMIKTMQSSLFLALKNILERRNQDD